MKISITFDGKSLSRYIDNAGKQARFAAALALTRTAQDVQKVEKAAIRQSFERPKAFTVNAIRIKAARRDNLQAEVRFDTRATNLIHQIQGGERTQKAYERRLQASGLMPAGWRTVPGSGVQLDAYGNVSRATLLRIFRALGLSQGKGNSKRSTETIFAVPQRTNGLSPGIYSRKGRVTKALLVYVPEPRYRRRFDFYRLAARTVQARFSLNFAAAYRQAMATAR